MYTMLKLKNILFENKNNASPLKVIIIKCFLRKQNWKSKDVGSIATFIQLKII